MTVQEQSHLLSADSISDPVPDETSQTPILDPPGNSDTNPNHDWQTAPLDTGSKERRLPTEGTPEHFSPVDALSSLCHDGSLFMENTFTSSPHSAPDILTFDLETADHDVLAVLFLADDSGPIVSEDAAMSLSNFANTQSAQLSQKTKSGPLPWELTASESPSSSSVAGSTEDPPAPHFSADLLTDSPPQSAGPQALRVLAWKALPPAQIRESEDQHSPRNINPESSCLKDMSPKDDLNSAIPAPASSSAVADSHPDSSDAQVDGNSSGSVPEEQILESPEGLPISQELASPCIFSEFRTRERHVTEKKCENILEKGATTSEMPKKTARKAREEGMAKMSFEQKEENKENDTELVKVRRSQRLSGQNEKEKAGLSGGFKTERADERKPSERSIKKDGVIYEKQSRRSSGGRQLCKREESNFEEQSQGTKITHTVEQFSEMGKKEQHQKLRVEIQRLELKSLPSHCSPASASCSETKVENTLSTTTPQEKSEKDEESIKRKQEGIQISGFVRRRTRSITTEEKAQLIPPSASGDGRKSQHSQMETSEIEASPEREMQDRVEVNVKEFANESVSSPVKTSRSRKDEEESSETANDTNKDLQIKVGKVNEDSANFSTVSPPTASSQRSPGVQTAPPTDMIMIDQGGQEAPGEAPLNDRDEHKHPLSSLESPSVKNPKLSPSLDPESIQLNQQQGKTVALSEDGACRHSEVMQTKTCDFYSSTSPKPKVSSRKPSPDQTEDVKGEGERANGEEAKHPSLPLSPMKRYRQEHEASEETKVNETENVGIETEIIKSPMKRARWKIKMEVDSRRAEKQRQTWIEKGDEGSSGKDETFGVCTPRTRSKTKAVDKLISNPSCSTGQETSEGEETAGKTPSRDERSATKTRMMLRRIQVPRFPSKKQRRLSKLPTKYTDFILHKPKVMGKKRREKEKQKEVGKRRTTQTPKPT
ncbi:protein IWS1 homolog isoform X1 [Seriola aureovittata]|uniref:protein IWS1 homolog isoform X1 n=1 Tax=Seriola aureovittata TaxID=2871759 RepID=UPI0024BE9D4A|nr:protein IWS1 homolog isoform X1 [Seriola aureovittata]XP_056225740.1 protein IWS1 homolog isoform X1 [Seriola aureovittata]XP_056225741.1 protein IWS1 homolog isoform X1 [Seriola aureovittata]